MELQSAKQLVRDFYRDLDAADAQNVSAAMTKYTGANFNCQCSYPFNDMGGVESFATEFWVPFKSAFAPVQRRENIFFAGRNRLDDYQTLWVCSMGHLLGQFQQPWLGLEPTHKMAFLRYYEFFRIENGKIAESSLHIDVFGMMIQAGSKVIPQPTGVYTITPCPQTQDGLLFGPCPPEQGEASLDILYRMLDTLISSGVHTTIEDLKKDWADDMLWWGPAGIGAS